MSKYLVTGGFGFMGYQLALSLAKTNDVTILAPRAPAGVRLSDNIRVVEGSTADRAALEQAFDGAEVCFHLAGLHADHDLRHDRSNGQTHLQNYAQQLFDVAHANGRVPVIYASSAAVYAPQNGPIAETAKTEPVNAHGVEKLDFEREARRAFEERGVPSAGLRFFNVYGPTQSLSSIYCGAARRFIDMIQKGEAIRLYGGGDQVRDWLYIDDAVQGMIKAAEAKLDDALLVNIGTGHGTSIRDLAHTIEELMGIDARYENFPRGETDVLESIADTSKARALFGFEAKTLLRTGLGRMIQHIVDRD